MKIQAECSNCNKQLKTEYGVKFVTIEACRVCPEANINVNWVDLECERHTGIFSQGEGGRFELIS